MSYSIPNLHSRGDIVSVYGLGHVIILKHVYSSKNIGYSFYSALHGTKKIFIGQNSVIFWLSECKSEEEIYNLWNR